MLTTIDLFCGAGGLSEGLRQAGCHVVAANDFDDRASETYRLNHPETEFLEGPIQDIRTQQILKVAGVKRGELDLLAGGPPCQAFSVYNHQRGMHDERSGLFREYLRIVKGVMPRFVVMENVTGMTSVDGGRAVDEIYTSLENLGFHVEHDVLKAESYGVPQERRRLVFLASRDLKEIRWPELTHASLRDRTLFDGGGSKPLVTVEDAIGDLPALKITEGEDKSRYSEKPKTSYQREMRKGSRHLYNHVAPYLAEINRRRLKHIPEGGSWRDIPHELLPAGMKRAKRSDHTKRYGRLHSDRQASTILTKCDLHWGAYIHPSQERTLTVREAARLQSFPDRIRFLGCKGDQFRQVGNAVPPLLGKAIGEAIVRMLNGTRIRRKRRSLVH